MILICGDPDDEVIDYVRTTAAGDGVDYRLLDLSTFPSGYTLTWRFDQSGPTGHIATSDWLLDLSELTGVFVRYPPTEHRRLSSELPLSHARAASDEAVLTLIYLLEQLPCIVVNRHSAGLSNSSKTYQAGVIRRSGFRTPPTLVTTNPDEARRFCVSFDSNVIYKGLSNWPSAVRRFEPDRSDHPAFAAGAPVQLQAYIAGQEIRVHTVGYRQVFATLVTSDAVDYRWPLDEGTTLTMASTNLPSDVARACLALSRTFDLPFAGIDLRVSPDNQWYCFEVNPSPGFTFFERQTAQPIGRALTEFLSAGS